jgi:hypothetical protein
MNITRTLVIRSASGLLAAVALLWGASDGGPSPDPEPRWWKGNLHTHTYWSDGNQFPEMVAEWYRDHGYHFLTLSDHNILSRGQRWVAAAELNRRAGVDAVARYRQRYGDAWVQTRGDAASGGLEVRLKPLGEVRALVEEPGRFLMMEGEELTGAAGDGRTLHMNATNLAEWVPFVKGATVRESMVRNLEAVEQSAARTGQDVLAHLNHPNFRWGVTAEDLAAVVEERFFEVWNGVDNDNDPGDAVHPSTEQIWDIANTLRKLRYQGPPLFGLATDDSHHYHGNRQQCMPGRAWVMVEARRLSPESILGALRAGRFYATTGVVLEEVRFDPQARRLSLRIHAEPGEEFVTRFIGTRRGASIRGVPRRDAAGEPVDTTLDYRTSSGPPIGEVLAEVPGLSPGYDFRGDELYVRATITSTGRPEVPSREHPCKRAWTQPAGW